MRSCRRCVVRAFSSYLCHRAYILPSKFHRLSGRAGKWRVRQLSASSLWSTRVTPGPVAENVNFSHQDPSCVEYRRNIISQREFEPPTRRNPATRNPKLRYLANSIIHALLRPRSYSEPNVLRQIKRRDLVRDLFQTLHRNSSTRKIARFPRLSPTIPFIEYKFGEEGCSRDRTNSKRVLLFIAVHSRSSRPMHGSERVKFSHLPPHRPYPILFRMFRAGRYHSPYFRLPPTTCHEFPRERATPGSPLHSPLHVPSFSRYPAERGSSTRSKGAASSDRFRTFIIRHDHGRLP